jgi:elongation factor G
MDVNGADFYRVVDMMKARLGANAVPIQIPIGVEADFVGMIDLVTMKALIYSEDLKKEPETTEIPPEMREKAEVCRQAMLDAVAENDDALMMKYLEGEEFTEQEFRAGLWKAGVECKLTPVL